MRRLEATGKGILLLHDIHPETVAALPGLLKELKDKGFHVVQVVPSASYLIAMANKPKARIVASTFAEEPTIADDDHTAPRWPQVVAKNDAELAALPVPDAAAFEPDVVPSEDVADIQWPVQIQVTPRPIAKAKGVRKHKMTRSGEKRKQRLAHDTKAQQRAARTHKDRHEGVRAGADGHHVDGSAISPSVTSRAKAFTVLSTPAQAAAR